MMELGAVQAGIKQRSSKEKTPRQRTPSEEEATLMVKTPHTDIQDIDIRENTKTKLRFRKLPWTEWLVGLGLLVGAGLCYGYPQLYEVKKIYELFANIIAIILVIIAGVSFYEGRIESVIFDRKNMMLTIRRTDSTCQKKQTWHVS